MRFLPGTAADSLAQPAPPEVSLTYLPPGPALAVVAAWPAVSIATAHANLRRRDA